MARTLGPKRRGRRDGRAASRRRSLGQCQHQHKPPHGRAARLQGAAAPADCQRTSQRARG
eukprot:3625740-Pyramimonas_sp.AAC.1